MFERETRRDAAIIRTAADQLAASAQAAAPGTWRIATNPGDIDRIVTDAGHDVVALTGMWASSTAQYLVVMAPSFAELVVDLLRANADVIRAGEMPTRLHSATLRIATGLRWEGV